jgi:hypothetical protein
LFNSCGKLTFLSNSLKDQNPEPGDKSDGEEIMLTKVEDRRSYCIQSLLSETNNFEKCQERPAGMHYLGSQAAKVMAHLSSVTGEPGKVVVTSGLASASHPGAIAAIAVVALA